MEFSEILHLAAQGRELPPFQSLPDRLCWQSLSALRRAYDHGEADAERVKWEKQELRRAHAEYTEAYRQYVEAYREYGARRVRAGGKVRELLEAKKAEPGNYRRQARLAAQALALALGEEGPGPLSGIGEDVGEEEKRDG